MGIKEQCGFSDGWPKCFDAGHGVQKVDVCGQKDAAHK
jgi:hypothetical protein